MAEEIEEKQIVAMVLKRLCGPVPEGHRVVDFEDEDLSRASRVAMDWQKIGAWAEWWELHGATKGADEDRLYFLAGRMAAAGEQLGLAYTSCLEVAIWLHNYVSGKSNTKEAIAIRALSELAIYFTLGAGHALANCLTQALAIEEALRARLQQHLGSSFPPYSESKKDWVSLNEVTLQKCLRACGVFEADPPTDDTAMADPAVVALVESVDSLVKDVRWQDAFARRNEDFHRWRPQSPGIAGVGRQSVWEHGEVTRSFGFGGRSYSEADALPLETARIAKAALSATTETFDRYLEVHWPKATKALGVPLFKDG